MTEPETLVRRERCIDCAFRPSTGPKDAPLTLLKAKLSVKIGEHFFCHLDVENNRIMDDPEALCAGWFEAVVPRLKNGAIDALPPEEVARIRAVLHTISIIEMGLGGAHVEGYKEDEFRILRENDGCKELVALCAILTE